MNLDNYYQTLGLERNASQDDIKKRFRALAFQYHPDRSPQTESRFKEILEAYEILTGKREAPREVSLSSSAADVRTKVNPYTKEYMNNVWKEILKELNESYNRSNNIKPKLRYPTDLNVDLEKIIQRAAIISVGFTVAGALLQYFGALDLIIDDCPSGHISTGLYMGAVIGLVSSSCGFLFKAYKESKNNSF